MHVAICDDNVADRKQLERLLSRESDKRLSTTGNLYADSYGHPNSLLKNPMQYDVFFLHIQNTEDFSTLDIVHSLSALGSAAPVVLFEEFQKEALEAYKNPVLHMHKPVRPEDLSKILDEALAIKNDAKPVIELREDKGTHYVSEEKILYAKKEGRLMLVTLLSGQKIAHSSSPASLYAQLEPYPTFLALDGNTIINTRHIKEIHLFSITMCDGTKHAAFGSVLAQAKKLHQTQQ